MRKKFVSYMAIARTLKKNRNSCCNSLLKPGGKATIRILGLGLDQDLKGSIELQTVYIFGAVRCFNKNTYKNSPATNRL